MSCPKLFKSFCFLLMLCMLFSFPLGKAAAQTGNQRLAGGPLPPGQAPASDPEPQRPVPGALIPGSQAAPRGPDGNPIQASPNFTVTLGAWRNLRPTESYLRGISLLPPSYSVNCKDPDQKSRGWIVGDVGTILRYCNGVWDHAIVPESVPTSLFGVQAISPTLSVAVGAQGAVLMYQWDHVALDWVWTKSPIPLGSQLLYGVSMVRDPDDPDPRCKGQCYTGWAVGEKDSSGKGTLVHGRFIPDPAYVTTTFNYSWENLTGSFPNLPEVDFYFNVQMLNADNGWAVGGKGGTRGVFLHWDGSTWSVFQEVGSDVILGLKMISATDGWATSGGGKIYRFNGSTWTLVGSPTTDGLTDIDFAPSGEGWAVGFNGALVRYVNGGWSKVPTEERTTDPFDFWGLDFTSGHGWISGFHISAGVGGHILEYEDGLWWAVSPPTDNTLNRVAVVNDNDAWAVGMADSVGGTIVHWDGKHWRRWFQYDLEIPAVDLYALDLADSSDGWAAGDTTAEGEPAVFLHWDGSRWAPPRYKAPVNVRVNDLDLERITDPITQKPYVFGWAVANNGSAVAKFDSRVQYEGVGYWDANSTCGGLYYQITSVSLITSPVSSETPLGWDAWSVTTNNPTAWSMHYMGGCGGGFAWERVSTPVACPNDDGTIPDDGPTATTLRGVKVVPATGLIPNVWGFADGNYRDRFSIYGYYPAAGWYTSLCMAQKGAPNPSRLYTVDALKKSAVAWMGGYLTYSGFKEALIIYFDVTGYHWGNYIFPLNGTNIFHRPIKSLRMSSDTMGWAVGEAADVGARDRSVIYQYPYPNFTLDSQPASRAVMPGASTDFTITVNSIGGFNTDVTISLGDEVPAGLDVNIINPTVNSDMPGKVQVTAAVGAAEGYYEIPLIGAATFRSGDIDIPVQRYFNLRVTVTNHPLDSISPSKGPANTVLTLSGPNFGPDPGVGNRSKMDPTDPTKVYNGVMIGSALLPDDSVLSWSNTQITARVPDNATLFPHGPIKGYVSVYVSGSHSNADQLFQLENKLTQIASVSGADTITVTLTGTSLGNDPGPLFRSTYFEHVNLSGAWIPNTDVLSWSNNTITFRVPVDTPKSTVVITSNGYESNGLELVTNRGRLYLPYMTKAE